MIDIPISCAIHAVNGGYIVSVPSWDEGEPFIDFHTFASLPTTLKFVKRTIEALDSQAKTADDAETAEIENE